MSDPFSDIPQVQGSMGGPLVNFVKIVLQRLGQGAKALPGEAGAAAAPLQEELTSQALSGPFQGLVGAPRGFEGLPHQDEIDALVAQGRRPGPAEPMQSLVPSTQILPRPPELEGSPEIGIPGKEGARQFQDHRGKQMEAEQKGLAQAQDQALKELEFSARDTGQPSPEALARLEEAVTKRHGPEHAQRLMQRVRAKFELGAEAEPQGSVIDALRGMGEGVAPQDMESAANVYARLRDEEAAKSLGLEGGFPENVVPPSRFEQAHSQRELTRAQRAQGEMAQDLSKGEGQGNIAGVVDQAKALGSAAERRVAQTPRFLQSLRAPSGDPARLQEAALRQRAEMAGVSVGDAGSARIVVDDDVVAETITGLTKKGEHEALGHMYTNPSTGQVRMSVLATKPQRLVQIGFPDRTAAFRWVAANMGQARRETMLNAERLEAFSRAQEASMGKPVGQILLD